MPKCSPNGIHYKLAQLCPALQLNQNEKKKCSRKFWSYFSWLLCWMCRGRLLIRQPQPGATQTVSKGQQAHGHELTAFPLMHNCIPSLCVSLSHWHLWEAGVLVSFEGRGTTGAQPTELHRLVFQIIKIEENLLKLITLFYGADTHTQFCSGTILASFTLHLIRD